MKDFIVNDEEEESGDDDTEQVKNEKKQQKELNTSNSELLAYYIPQCKIKISYNSIFITCF